MPDQESGLKGKAWVKERLIFNGDKEFVQRLFKTDAPKLDIGNGSTATYKMSWGHTGPPEDPETKIIVYPNIVYDKKIKSLNWLPSREAQEHAKKTGEYIEVNDPAEAEELSINYKEVLPNFNGGPGTGGPGSKSIENPNSEAYKLHMKTNKRKLGLITTPVGKPKERGRK